jgi:hypothetical protein
MVSAFNTHIIHSDINKAIEFDHNVAENVIIIEIINDLI